MAHGYQRLLLAHALHQAFILRGQIGLFLMTGRPGRLHQRRPQIAAPFGGLAALALACRFVVARTHPRPARQVVLSGEALHGDPDLRYDDLGDGLPYARDGVEQRDGFRHERVRTVLTLLPDPRFRSLVPRLHWV